MKQISRYVRYRGAILITRRAAALAIAGAGIAVAVTSRTGGARANSAASASPVVKTSAGSVQGVEQHGVLKFLGIPYGASTHGVNRFLPPRPVVPWSGVRVATAYGDSCPQVPLGLSPFIQKGSTEIVRPPSAMQQQLGTLFSRPEPEPALSEDCLVLNVWTVEADSSRRPVMVWLHGGGFAVGSGSGPAYEGTHLAMRGDVVVVTINHRLNVFGHLYLGDIAGEAFRQSGNVGMLDIVAALQWVRDNIANFGGDPANVTIFGESGGAGKVSVICAMPGAKGLFHKAIMQSGPCLEIADRERGTAIARQLFRDLGLTAGDVGELQKWDAMKLSAAANAAEVKVVPRVLGFGPMGMIPVVDGVVLQHHPFDTVAAPESADVPFIVGSTKDEAVLFAGPFPQWGQFSEADVVDRLRPLAGARAQQALNLYKKLHPTDSPSYLLVDLVTDYWMRQAANRVAELKVKQQAAAAYVYVLDWEINPELRSPHGTDVALVFNNPNASPAIGAAMHAQAVADQMSAAWVAFARSGNPNDPKLPHWPRYSLPARPNMTFDINSRVVNDYGHQAREFWERA
jgi:para-nitrobenzyl esterase